MRHVERVFMAAGAMYDTEREAYVEAARSCMEYHGGKHWSEGRSPERWQKVLPRLASFLAFVDSKR